MTARKRGRPRLTTNFTCGHPKSENSYTNTKGVAVCKECRRLRYRSKPKTPKGMFACGHEMSKDNSYSFMDKGGIRTACRTCRLSRAANFRKRERESLVKPPERKKTNSGSGQIAGPIIYQQYKYGCTRLG